MAWNFIPSNIRRDNPQQTLEMLQLLKLWGRRYERFSTEGRNDNTRSVDFIEYYPQLQTTDWGSDS